METDRLPFFLAQARDWWAAADALRAAGLPDGDPALRVWREAAWCDLLAGRGLHAAALANLRRVAREVAGGSPEPARLPAGEAGVRAAAAVLFARLRAAVSARHPAAFDRPAA